MTERLTVTDLHKPEKARSNDLLGWVADKESPSISDVSAWTTHALAISTQHHNMLTFEGAEGKV
eukprot:scaffold5806_cov171-Ochromonas_danica.AAC.2